MAVMKVMVGIRKKSRNTFKPIHNSIVVDKGVRVSKRLTMKKKQKAGVSCSIKKLHRTVEFAKSPIEYSNPSHKLLFLTGLGLTPKEGIMMPPYVLLERLQPTSKLVTPKIPTAISISKQCQRSKSLDRTKSQAVEVEFPEIQLSDSDTDVDDLDLELLVYPLDIPEFLEEICEKPRKCRPLQTTTVPVTHAKNTRSGSGTKALMSSNSVRPSHSLKQREDFYIDPVCSSQNIIVIDITEDSDDDLF